MCGMHFPCDAFCISHIQNKIFEKLKLHLVTIFVFCFQKLGFENENEKQLNMFPKLKHIWIRVSIYYYCVQST